MQKIEKPTSKDKQINNQSDKKIKPEIMKLIIGGIVTLIAAIITAFGPRLAEAIIPLKTETPTLSSTLTDPTNTLEPTSTHTLVPSITPVALTATPSATNLLFEDDFSKADLDVSYWSSGELSGIFVENSQLKFDFTNNSDDWTAAFVEANLNGKNAKVIEFDIMITDGSSQGQAGFGTSCNSTENSSIGFGIGIGRYEIFHETNGVRVDLDTVWGLSFEQQKTYSFRFEQIDDQVFVTIDNQLIEEPLPCDSLGGWFFLAAGGTSGSSISGAFDNVRLFSGD